MTRAIGIDLGTTYSLAATIENGRPLVLPNSEGSYLTPSVVCFAEDGLPWVGEPAKRAAASMPHRTVFSIKRRIGSDYRVKVDDMEYTPAQVSGFILKKVKADAEEQLGERIDRAVITVPAYFNDRQRQATREAGALAGLEVMRIISEPTAAALAYGIHREEAHTVLVWDLGGGTFDVSILELGDGIFEVRAVSGDTWLGGDDFDLRIADDLAQMYRSITGAAFPSDLGSRQRLKEAAEMAKIELSSALVAKVRLPLPDSERPRCLELELSRERMENAVHALVRRMVAPTHEALAGAGLSVEEIDRVILVGGASRMTAVRSLARQLFGKEPYRYVQPDLAVAMGAAIQAGMLLGQVEKVVLLDVLPLSLGIETEGGLMARLIPRNTPLPASGTRIFTTAKDCQTSMSVHVLQGERAMALDDISLGQFDLSGIPSAARGVPKVEVAFQVDVDGIVHVSATELLTEGEMNVAVTSAKFLDPQEIAGLAQEGALSEERDIAMRQRVMAGIQARNLIAAGERVLDRLDDPRTGQLPAAIANLKLVVAAGVAEEIYACAEVLRWLLAATSMEEPSRLDVPSDSLVVSHVY
ncbi:MAG: Hsp70 family protein [Dehalococcoidia bacterium]|nr:Hsp70 family protein [Dehalococcoidia bacterium]